MPPASLAVHASSRRPRTSNPLLGVRCIMLSGATVWFLSLLYYFNASATVESEPSILVGLRGGIPPVPPPLSVTDPAVRATGSLSGAANGGAGASGGAGGGGDAEALHEAKRWHRSTHHRAQATERTACPSTPRKAYPKEWPIMDVVSV